MNILRSLYQCNKSLEDGVSYCTGNTLSIDAIHVSAKAYQALGMLSDYFSGSSIRDISSSLSIFQEFRAFSRLPRYILLAFDDGAISFAFSKFSYLPYWISDVSHTVVAGALAINGLKRIFSAAPVLSMTMQHSSVYSPALLTVQILEIRNCIKRIQNLNAIGNSFSPGALLQMRRSSYIELIDLTGAAIFGMAHFLQASSETVRLAWAVSSLCSFGKLMDHAFVMGGGRSFVSFSARSV